MKPGLQTDFGEFLVVKTCRDTTICTILHYMRLRSVCTKYVGRTEILPEQKTIFALAILQVPGQISRCPCGVGTYGCQNVNKKLKKQLSLLWINVYSKTTVQHIGQFESLSLSELNSSCKHSQIAPPPPMHKYMLTRNTRKTSI